MRKLTIALATRGRPELCIWAVEETLKNITLPDTRIVICADEDDEKSDEALFDFAGMHEGLVILATAPRPATVAEKFNRAIGIAPADVYLAMVDYHAHRTYGFDAKILEAASLFPDGIGVVYGRMANDCFPELNAVTHRWAELTGSVEHPQMYPELFPTWFVDHWLDDVAKMTGRISVAPVVVDCSRRPGTQALREAAFWANFYDACRVMRREQVVRILEAPDCVTPEWEKAVLRSRAPLVEYSSQRVNDSVRADEANLAANVEERGPPPAGYIELRDRAIDIMAREMPRLLGRTRMAA